MKVFIAAVVKGPQESKAQVHSSNSNSRGKSLTFLTYLNLHFHLWATIPELLLAYCSEITIPPFTLPSKPSVNTNRPLISCCDITKLGALVFGKNHVSKSCTEVFPIRLEYACLPLSTFLRGESTSVYSYYNESDCNVHNV